MEEARVHYRKTQDVTFSDARFKNRPFFRANAVDNALQLGESYRKVVEHVMEDNSEEDRAARFEVLEFWGFVDKDIIKDQGVDIPKDLEDADQLSVNIWVCNGQVLRLVMNPFTPLYSLFCCTLRNESVQHFWHRYC